MYVDPELAIRDFHEKFEIEVGNSWIKPERRELRIKLIREEFEEYLEGEAENNPTKVLDALVDMVYVIIGAAIEYGFDFSAAFEAVHLNNMAKLGPDGRPIIREDGKVLKPEGWKPIDVTPYTNMV